MPDLRRANGRDKIPPAGKMGQYWGLVKWHHVALWTRNLRFESLIPSWQKPGVYPGFSVAYIHPVNLLFVN